MLFLTFCEDQVGGALFYYASIAFLREGDRTVKLTRERLRAQKGDKNVLEVGCTIRRRRRRHLENSLNSCRQS
jgi:hypothetical protein